MNGIRTHNVDCNVKVKVTTKPWVSVVPLYSSSFG